MAAKKQQKPLEIVIDTREQLPWRFNKYDDVSIFAKKLDEGDYSIYGFEDQIAIERKGMNDFLSSITQGRERFEREIERLSAKRFKFIIVEKTLHIVFTETILNRRIHPNSIIGTLASWHMKYGVQFFFMENAKYAEEMAYRIFKNFNEKYREL